jgi:hypothetical protein
MTIQMFDSTTIDAIPLDAEAVGGYIGGWYLTYWRLVARCPNALHLAIAINAEEDAECLDVEAGDATPADVPAWVRRQQERGVHRPVVYSSVTTMPTIISLLDESGIPASAIRIWTAHYTHEPHICALDSCGHAPGASVEATQWTDRAFDGNLDASLCSDTFFGPPPPAPDPNHYSRYPVGPYRFRDPAGRVLNLNERAIVQEYDHLRIHADLNRERLDELRVLLTFLRKRVWYVAHYDRSTGRKRPAEDWSSSFRGWRWRLLLARSRGELVAK